MRGLLRPTVGKFAISALGFICGAALIISCGGGGGKTSAGVVAAGGATLGDDGNDNNNLITKVLKAIDVVFENSDTGLNAENVQDALVEVNGKVGAVDGQVNALQGKVDELAGPGSKGCYDDWVDVFGTYCIEATERPAADFPNAASSCAMGGGRLCSGQERLVACYQKAGALNGITNNWEWTGTILSGASGTGPGVLTGNGSCYITTHTPVSAGSNKYPYRCCHDLSII